MSIDYSGKRTRTHLRRMKAMRDAVWERDGREYIPGDQVAHCVICLARVYRRRPPFGEVHHVESRSTHPAEKYDPANGEILCRYHHESAH